MLIFFSKKKCHKIILTLLRFENGGSPGFQSVKKPFRFYIEMCRFFVCFDAYISVKTSVTLSEKI